MKQSREYVLELYKQVEKGKTIKQLAKELNKGKETIRQWFLKEGLDTSLHKNKPKFNENYFSNIDSFAKAYYLGLIYADGCIVNKDYCLFIYLQENDRYIIKEFKACLNSKNKIQKRIGTVNQKTKYGLALCSKQMFKDLTSLGLVPNKSQLGLKFPDIDSKYYSSFILGFFDGDGSITINQRYYKNNRNGINRKFKLVCTDKSFLKTICNILLSNNISKGKIYCNLDKRSNRIPLYSLEYWKIVDLKNLYKYLYKDSNIFLTRKKEKMSISMLTVRELQNLKVL